MSLCWTRRPCLVLVWVACSGSAALGVDPTDASLCPRHLFVLGRSKNANLVVYDARTTGSVPDRSRPVEAYWLLGGENGEREELNFIEWQYAFGFDLAPGGELGTYIMRFRADPRRPITIRSLGPCPAAIGSIGGKDAVLQRIFVKTVGGGIPRVESIELFGVDLTNGEPLYERLTPNDSGPARPSTLVGGASLK